MLKTNYGWRVHEKVFYFLNDTTPKRYVEDGVALEDPARFDFQLSACSGGPTVDGIDLGQSQLGMNPNVQQTAPFCRWRYAAPSSVLRFWHRQRTRSLCSLCQCWPMYSISTIPFNPVNPQTEGYSRYPEQLRAMVPLRESSGSHETLILKCVTHGELPCNAGLNSLNVLFSPTRTLQPEGVPSPPHQKGGPVDPQHQKVAA